MEPFMDDTPELEEFDLPELEDVHETGRKGDLARERGNEELAYEKYQDVLGLAEEYLEQIEEIRNNEILSSDQEESLERVKDSLVIYKSILKDQIVQMNYS